MEIRTGHQATAQSTRLTQRDIAMLVSHLRGGRAIQDHC